MADVLTFVEVAVGFRSGELAKDFDTWLGRGGYHRAVAGSEVHVSLFSVWDRHTVIMEAEARGGRILVDVLEIDEG